MKESMAGTFGIKRLSIEWDQVVSTVAWNRLQGMLRLASFIAVVVDGRKESF